MPSFFQTLSSLFSGPSTSSRDNRPISTAPQPRRRQPAISPTADAFSLPTHSPILSGNYSPAQPNVASSSTTPFSYPPQRSSYDYDYPSSAISNPVSSPSQALRGIRQKTTSPILPLHHTPTSALPINSPMSPNGYPPLHHTWNRLRSWLNSDYTELGDTLNWGVQPQVLNDVILELAMQLPPAVRESYLCCDGQEVESSAGCSDGLFFGLTLLPLEDVLEEWRFWREVDEDPATGANDRLRSVMKSIPEGYIRREYSCKGWLPLVTDRAGNYLGVDLYPDARGDPGQVIIFGRDFDTKVVMWRGEGQGGWGRWLAGFVDELENGEGYELGGSGNDSSGSEDEVGYESYFYSPSGGSRDPGSGGGGGLRLTGEYKGWNVLEAWADRSVKQWIEAGLYKEEEPEPSPRPEIEITDAAALANPDSAAEVPIPVLGASSDDITAPAHRSSPNAASATTNATPSSTRPQSTQPSTVAVTVPPVQPVLLPTARDLLSETSPESTAPNSPQMSQETVHSIQALISAPSGKLRTTADDVPLPVEPPSSATPLVGDTSFSSRESSLAEASLMAPSSIDTEATTASETFTPGDNAQLDETQLKTPVAKDFPKTISSGPSESHNGVNGTTEVVKPVLSPLQPVDTSSIITSSPISSSPMNTSASREASNTTSASNSRPSTPNTLRKQAKGLHKKSNVSISKLFKDKDKDRPASPTVADDDKTSKRGSMFKSLVGGGKAKERKRSVSDVPV